MFPELLFVAAYVVFALVTLGVKRPWAWIGADAARWLADGLQAATREHGFLFEPRRPRSPRAHGRRGDYEVSLELRSYGGSRELGSSEDAERKHYDLHVSLACPRLPQRVSFSPQGGRSADWTIGDTLFDDAVEVGGDPVILAALLEADVRLRLRKLVAWDGCLRDGRLSWQAEVSFGPDEVPRMIGELAELADRLTVSRGGLCERLARNSSDDVSDGVRLSNLSLLQQHFADRPETATASRSGLVDRSPWVRLAAARFLPDGSQDTLRSLLADGQTPEHAAAEAAALVAARLPREDAAPLLVSALRSRRGETRRQAIEELGRLKHAPSVRALCVLLRASDPRTAAAAADALGAIGDPKAEAHLLEAVAQDAVEPRLAAAHALGGLGTVRAVEPLLARLEQKLDAESRQALRKAVGAIQSRLTGAEAGQLSLAVTSAEAGRLSLATPRAGPGDVSLADEPDP